MIPPRLLGALRESDDILFSADESRRRLAQDGYLLFCRALPVHDVIEARRLYSSVSRKSTKSMPRQSTALQQAEAEDLSKTSDVSGSR